MNADWQRIKLLLGEAVRYSSREERAAYLDRVCPGDRELRAQVEALLRAHEQAGEFLERPALLHAPPDPPPLDPLPKQIGDWIGPYQLLEQIGEGGCGVVYLAQQEHPLRRQVALKLIKLGMDTRAVIARFEAERQALALMDHPNIARVLDAGATENGRPYFVMEWVRGVRITEYCDQEQLTTATRLNLFVQVCHALQHAHQKGIIHRDIKPSNVLVTMHDGAPVPKVIDFGIAKATEQRLTDDRLLTAFEQLIGTPAYMSPEQAGRGAPDTPDIDTRSDIYSLGVLLYELLTGHTPLDQQKLVAAGLDEMRRIIREVEPARPSTRLSKLATDDQTAIAQRRQSQPPQLISWLRGDLDWIVMRCLEKDPTRRYATASGLAEDLLRHLRDEPVTARPPSRHYRLGKLLRRNKFVFTVAGAVATALLLGLALSLWAWARERTARRQALAAERTAQTEAAKSGQVAQFLKDMLQGLGPSMALGRDPTMLREILDRTAERLGRDLSGQPAVETELRVTLGQVYEALGQYNPAVEMYRQVLHLERGLWGEMHTNVADALDRLGHALRSLQREAAESAELLEQALRIRQQLLGAEHVQIADSLHHLGGVELYRGRLLQAVDLFQRSLTMRRRLVGNEDYDVAESLTMLADTVRYLRRPTEAEAYAREALAILARVPPEPYLSLRIAAAQEALAGALESQGRLEEAVPLLRQVVTARQHLLGTDHFESASALFNLGCVLLPAKRLEAAEAAIQEAREICRRTVGDRHTLPAFCLEKLAEIYQHTGRFGEAEAAYREALVLWTPRENQHVRRARTCLTALLCAQGKFIEADRFLAEATAEDRESVAEARKRPPSQAGVAALLRLMEVLWSQGLVAETEPLMAEALATAQQLPFSPCLAEEISSQAMRIAALQVWLGRGAEHTALSRRLVSWAADQPEFTPKGRTAGMVNLAPVNGPQLQADAHALARLAVESAPTNDALLVWYRLNLGVAEYRLGHFPEAERILLASEQEGPPAWHPPARTCTSQFFRALMLFRQGQSQAARQLFSEAEAKTPPLPETVQRALAEGADYDDLMVWLAYKEARAALHPPASERDSEPKGR